MNCAVVSAEVNKLRAQCASLLKEVKEIRSENQSLRRKLASRKERTEMDIAMDTELKIKMEPTIQLDDELGSQDDPLDITQDPLATKIPHVVHSRGKLTATPGLDRNQYTHSRPRLKLTGQETNIAKKTETTIQIDEEQVDPLDIAQDPLAPTVSYQQHSRESRPFVFDRNQCAEAKTNLKCPGLERKSIQTGYPYVLQPHIPDIKCIICDSELTAKMVAQHTCISQSQLSCEYCAETFESLSKLNAHLVIDHVKSEKKSVACDVCERKFDMRALLKAHKKAVHFVCKCAVRFTSRSALSEHERVLQHGKLKNPLAEKKGSKKPLKRPGLDLFLMYFHEFFYPFVQETTSV